MSNIDPSGENTIALGKGAFRGGQAIGKGINKLAKVVTGKTLSLHIAVHSALNSEAGDKDASTPTGSRENPMEVEDGSNEPTEIDGRDYSGHALDRMQGRGVTPTAVEEAIGNGEQGEGNKPGTATHTDSQNGVQVVTNDDGKVVTVKHVKRDK